MGWYNEAEMLIYQYRYWSQQTMKPSSQLTFPLYSLLSRQHRLMAIASVYNHRKKMFNYTSKGLHLMSFCVSLHLFLQQRKRIPSKRVSAYLQGKCEHAMFLSSISSESNPPLHHWNTLPRPCRMIALSGSMDDRSTLRKH